MDFAKSTRKLTHILLKRRKDSFSNKWIYFKTGEHKFMSMITKGEYESLLKEDSDVETMFEAKLLKKLTH
jgi:hypothetical protein